MSDPHESAPESGRAPHPQAAQGPPPQHKVHYKGEVLEAERGPGLGCFRFQVVVLAILIVVTPLSVAWTWPVEVSAVLLIVTILLLLVTGQTTIFLLRLVAADRREQGRRRPLASTTKTVGELEDQRQTADPPAPPAAPPADPPAPPADSQPDLPEPPRPDPGGVRE